MPHVVARAPASGGAQFDVQDVRSGAFVGLHPVCQILTVFCRNASGKGFQARTIDQSLQLADSQISQTTAIPKNSKLKFLCALCPLCDLEQLETGSSRRRQEMDRLYEEAAVVRVTETAGRRDARYRSIEAAPARASQTASARGAWPRTMEPPANTPGRFVRCSGSTRR